MSNATTRGSRPPRQRSLGLRLLTVGVAIVVVIIVALAAVGRVAQREPTRRAAATTPSPTAGSPPSTVSRPSTQRDLPLLGVPLQGRTSLRLLVADAPSPFVLDVDGRTVQPIAGMPTNGDRGVAVLPVGEDALILSFRFCDRCRNSNAYLLRRGNPAVTPFGAALQILPSRDGEGAWILSRRRASNCTIRKVGLDGRPREAARQVSCRTGLVADLPAGLLVSSTGPLGSDAHSALLKPDGGLVRHRDPQAQPVVGNLVLSGADRRTPLLLHDMGGGASHRLCWPSRRDYSLAEVTGGPNGRLAVVEFAKYSPEHKLDMWLLDARTRHWQHLPGMPARIVPKATHVAWTADGRVVILSGNVLGVWRPGEPRLAVRHVKPARQSGSQFVIW